MMQAKTLERYGMEMNEVEKNFVYGSSYENGGNLWKRLKKNDTNKEMTDDMFGALFADGVDFVIKDMNLFLKKMNLEEKVPVVLRPLLGGFSFYYRKQSNRFHVNMDEDSLIDNLYGLDDYSQNEIINFVSPEYKLVSIFDEEGATETFEVNLEKVSTQLIELLENVDFEEFKVSLLKEEIGIINQKLIDMVSFINKEIG